MNIFNAILISGRFGVTPVQHGGRSSSNFILFEPGVEQIRFVVDEVWAAAGSQKFVSFIVLSYG